MNFNTETKSNKYSEESSDDSFEEMINSRQRQRYQVKPKVKDLSKIKIFVRLEKHKEIFNFKPDSKTTIKDIVEYFLEKNSSKLQEMYPISDLKVMLANVHGKKKDFPGEASNFFNFQHWTLFVLWDW